VLLRPQGDQAWRQPPAGERRQFMEAGMTPRAHRRQPAPIVLTGAAVMDMRTHWTSAASNAAAAVTREHRIRHCHVGGGKGACEHGSAESQLGMHDAPLTRGQSPR
jgi:hypothetical protein